MFEPVVAEIQAPAGADRRHAAHAGGDGGVGRLAQRLLDGRVLEAVGSAWDKIALALLTQQPRPSRDEIIRFMGGNICRCGTYPRIVAAIEEAARTLQGGAP